MKKNLLTVLILALLIVNIVLTSVMMFNVMGTNRKTAELVTNIATAINLELAVPGEEVEKEVISLEDTEVYALTGSLTNPLKSEEGGASYMLFEASFSLNKEHKDYKTYGGEAMAERESLIKDAIRTVIASHTESECRNDTEGLKAEILKAVQDLFQSDFIYDVSISEVKYG